MAWFRRSPTGLGIILLAVWLIATGVLALVPDLNFRGAGVALALLAIAAGVIILWERY